VYPILVFALLFALWVTFSGLLDPFHLALGLLSCAIVTWLSSSLAFEDRTKPMARRWREARRLPGYILWLLWQIFLANVHILKLALVPGGIREVDPRVVRFRTRLGSDFEKFALAQSITLTPGTVTVKISGDEFYVHAISRKAARGLDGSMERRIARVYNHGEPAGGSPDDGEGSPGR